MASMNPPTSDSLSRLPARWEFITFPFLHLDKFLGFPPFSEPESCFFLEMFHLSFLGIVEGEGSSPQLRSNPIKCNLISGQAQIRLVLQQQINQNKKLGLTRIFLVSSSNLPVWVSAARPSSALLKPRLFLLSPLILEPSGSDPGSRSIPNSPLLPLLPAGPLEYSNFWDTLPKFLFEQFPSLPQNLGIPRGDNNEP